jgi:hypothetical protein
MAKERSKPLYKVEAATYNLTKSLRIDSEMAKELKFIEKYEKTTAGTLMRMWIQDRIQSYLNNQRYRRWKRGQTKDEDKP